jgi:tetratricopeptide (TPR) repeat protein
LRLRVLAFNPKIKPFESLSPIDKQTREDFSPIMSLYSDYLHWTDEFDGIGREGAEALRQALAENEQEGSQWVACYTAFVDEAELNRSNVLAMLSHLQELRDRIAELKDRYKDFFARSAHRVLMRMPVGLLDSEKKQIRAFVDECIDYVAATDETKSAVALQNAREIMLDLGDHSAAAAYHEAYLKRNYSYSQMYCFRCQMGQEKDLSYAYRIGDTEKAMDLWLEMAERTYHRCTNEDESLGTRLHAELYFLSEQANWPELERAMQRLRLDETFHDEELYGFLVKGRQLDRAMKVFESRVSFYESDALAVPAFYFFLDSVVLMDQLVEAGQTELVLVTERKIPISQGRQATASVRQWLLEQLSQASQGLDDRNGSAFYQELMERTLANPHLLPKGM